MIVAFFLEPHERGPIHACGNNNRLTPIVFTVLLGVLSCHVIVPINYRMLMNVNMCLIELTLVESQQSFQGKGKISL
jgi:hypothetical protein